MTLRARLFLAALPVLLLFVAYSAFQLLHREQAQMLAETRSRAQALADLLAANSAYALRSTDSTLLQSDVNSTFLQPDVETVWVEDGRGRVLASSDPARAGTASGGASTNPDLLAVEAPVENQGQRLGTVRLALSEAPTRAAIERARQQVLVSSLVLLLAVLVLTVVAAHRLALPMQIVAATADQMADGFLSARVPVGRRGIQGQLAPLALTFNRMAEHIEKQVGDDRAARVLLAQRVARLVEITSAVSQGDLEQRAEVFADDDLGKLADDFNHLLSRMRHLLEKEQGDRVALERSAQALEEVHGRLSLADRQKSDFLVVVSHELRTPLTAIKAFAELLLDGVSDVDLRDEFLGIVQREAERLTRLINTLLDLSRIDAGRMDWRRELFTPSRLARTATNAVMPMALERNIRLDMLVADERPLEGDFERLVGALGELLQNGLQATEAGGGVRVYVADPSSSRTVAIVVEDRGCGVDPAHHVAVFERFWQVTRSLEGRERERPRGPGLGLPLARAIAAAHGGTVTVESSGVPGETTRFTLTLPLSRKGMQAASLTLLTESTLGRSVDSSRWRDMLARLLETPPN